MKIILVNYRYFLSGGPEKYLFNVKALLEKHGHTVIPFSVQSRQNQPSEYEHYFLKPVGKSDRAYFKDYNKFNPFTLLTGFSRMFYSFEARRKLGKLITDVRPDLIYVLHFQNKISSSIFDAARKHKIPVINRISDFGQICSNALFYRFKQNDICERCLSGSKMNAVINKCVHNSYLYSSIKAASLKFQEILGISRKIECFVVPSKFTLEKFKIFGVPASKLLHLPTFFNFQSTGTTEEITYQPFAVYVGRIEPEKGMLTMINAFENTSFALKIIGFSTSGFDEQLKNYLKDKNAKVDFLGKKTFHEITHYLSSCAFTIVPSECYDNFPNTVLESFAFKKAVIATNVGSLREIVIDNQTGLLFRLKDAQDLREKVTYLFKNNLMCQKLGESGFARLQGEYSEQRHYESLINLFNDTIKNYQSRHISLRPALTDRRAN